MIEERSYGIIPVIERDGGFYFLLIQHNAGHWAFPKGHALEGESDEQAAKRELLEETGISDILLLDSPAFKERYELMRNNVKLRKEVTYFIAFVKQTEIILQVSEVKDYRWANFKEALSLITFDEAKQLLRSVYEYLTLSSKEKGGANA
ncbi:NUDIX hydrolase [Candidatus Magnetoovum chiemensis]|nr:NUDIX hydrolase [Candidatus Magnetoovum chiemensis]